MKKRILIIEDDLDILEILSIIFQDDGYEVITNRNGMTTDEIGILSPDIILLDIRINGFSKTGAQICRELKSLLRTSNIPVIMISAEFNLSSISNECGADGYIYKPFELKEVLEKINGMIR